LLRVYDKVMTETWDREDKRRPRQARDHFRTLESTVNAIDPELWCVAFVDDEPVAFAVGAPNFDGGDGRPMGWVLDIGVVPSIRGQGIGTALLASWCLHFVAKAITR
jgi:GNAT superfamily N-acetyltransferase